MCIFLLVMSIFNKNLRSLSYNNISNISSQVRSHLQFYPCPININFFWNFGFLVGIAFVVQIVTGIVLALRYTSANSFESVIHIMREVQFGWLFRLIHASGASFVFIFLYLHMGRGLFGSSSASYLPMAWISGIILYFLTIIISFLGYVLPWGQMSFWGATVITNLFSFIPYLVSFLVGGYYCTEVTLARFFVLHFILPFVTLIIVVLHIFFLHIKGSSSPLGANMNLKVSFYPHMFFSDIKGFNLFLFLLLLQSFFGVIELSDPDNSITVNRFITPLQIVPEWYFLALYACLKIIPNRIIGIIILCLIFASLVTLTERSRKGSIISQRDFTNHNFSLDVTHVIYAFVALSIIGGLIPLDAYIYIGRLYLIILLYSLLFRNISDVNKKYYSTMLYSRNMSALQSYISIANLYGSTLRYFSVGFLYSLVLPLFTILLFFWGFRETLYSSSSMISSTCTSFILSEMLLFVAYFWGAYHFFFSLYVEREGLIMPSTRLLILVITYILACCSVLMGSAIKSRESLINFSSWGLLCFILVAALMFTSIQTSEYLGFSVYINDSTLGSFLFNITGLHFFHVIVGVLFVLFSAWSYSYVFVENNQWVHSMYEKSIYKIFYAETFTLLYWHFVEVLWLFIQFTFYSYRNNNFIISACNHKTLGLYYIWFSFIFGIMGSLLSLILRLELYSSGLRFISFENQNFYNVTFTIHGLVMVFFVIMPGLYGGFGNYFLPLKNGAPEVAFPRLNSISLLLLPVAFLLLMASVITEFGGGTGWTLYPPLSTSLLSPFTVDLIIVGLAFVGISSLLSSINFLTTIFHYRAKGLSLSTTSCQIYTWGILFTAVMLIYTLPILTGGLIMILTDLHLNTQYYDPSFAGDPVLFQHFFWFFGHPEVYIIILPGFSIVSHVLATSTQKTIFGTSSMILAMGCISIIGSLVWGHHMYTVGLEADTRAYFSAVTILVALPTATKVFHWLCSLMGTLSPTKLPSIYLTISFIILFTLGGTTGVILSNGSLDIALHDTYYVVAHFHFVLSLGAITSLFCGLCHYYDIFTGHQSRFSETLILWTFLFLFGTLMTFVPLHILGFNVMPRRIPDYADAVSTINMISSVGSLIPMLSFILLLC